MSESVRESFIKLQLPSNFTDLDSKFHHNRFNNVKILYFRYNIKSFRKRKFSFPFEIMYFRVWPHEAGCLNILGIGDDCGGSDYQVNR